jgi:hypothetical protein
MKNQVEAGPLKNLDEWEEDVLRRYPDPRKNCELQKPPKNTEITIIQNGIRFANSIA